MAKKGFFGIAISAIMSFSFFFVGCGQSAGQSYTTLDDNGVERELTFITKEQFDRIRISNENSAVSVLISFIDNTQATLPKVIKGTRPKFYGISYLSIKTNPSDPNVMAVIRYNNADKCFMTIIFLDKQI